MKDRLSLSITGLLILLLVITLAKRETATAQANDQTKPSPASAIFTTNTTFSVELTAGSNVRTSWCYVDGIKGDWIHCANKEKSGTYLEGWVNASQIITAFSFNSQ